jgi:hypothetical protein
MLQGTPKVGRPFRTLEGLMPRCPTRPPNLCELPLPAHRKCSQTHYAPTVSHGGPSGRGPALMHVFAVWGRRWKPTSRNRHQLLVRQLLRSPLLTRLTLIADLSNQDCGVNDSTVRSNLRPTAGRSPNWLEMKNSACPATQAHRKAILRKWSNQSGSLTIGCGVWKRT